MHTHHNHNARFSNAHGRGNYRRKSRKCNIFVSNRKLFQNRIRMSLLLTRSYNPPARNVSTFFSLL